MSDFIFINRLEGKLLYLKSSSAWGTCPSTGKLIEFKKGELMLLLNENKWCTLLTGKGVVLFARTAIEIHTICIS